MQHRGTKLSEELGSEYAAISDEIQRQLSKMNEKLLVSDHESAPASRRVPVYDITHQHI